jgi:hypothetical protein
VVARLIATTAVAVALAACQKNTTTPTMATPSTAALTITFTDNPAPFRTTGCNASTPQGWYTDAKIQETAGVSFTPATFTQKLDGAPSGSLVESFGSRFGACSGGTSTPGVISANGSACGTVGVCTASTYSTYQFEVTGNDANGHALTFTSPMLQLAPRPAGQSVVSLGSRLLPVPSAPIH